MLIDKLEEKIYILAMGVLLEKLNKVKNHNGQLLGYNSGHSNILISHLQMVQLMNIFHNKHYKMYNFLSK